MNIYSAGISNQITVWYVELGPWFFYALVWGLVFAGTGLFIGAFIPFITGDSLVFAAGLVAATHSDVNIWPMAFGIAIAAWLGDQVGFALGLYYGRPYLEKRKGKFLQGAIAKSENFYHAWGWWAIVVGRFIPWARVFLPVIAGISMMNYYKFFSANIFGAVIWGVGLSVAGYFAASLPWVKNATYLIAAALILASAIAGVRAWLRNRNAV
jgi:membrane-associated protein